MKRIVAYLFSASVFLQRAELTDQAKSIKTRCIGFQPPDAERAKVTKQLALQIRQLPSAAPKASLAAELANFATEGDSDATPCRRLRPHWHRVWRRNPANRKRTFRWLSWCVTNTCKSLLDSLQLKAAMANWRVTTRLGSAPISPSWILNGKSWTLKSLEGKIVLVNFWPPGALLAVRNA